MHSLIAYLYLPTLGLFQLEGTKNLSTNHRLDEVMPTPKPIKRRARSRRVANDDDSLKLGDDSF